MSSQYPRGKYLRTSVTSKERANYNSIKSYLVRDPGGQIHDAIQDYMPGTLHLLRTVPDARTGRVIPRGTLQPHVSQRKRLVTAVGERTIHEIESKEGAIRKTPKINQFVIAHDRVSQMTQGPGHWNSSQGTSNMVRRDHSDNPPSSL